jgi:pimeloyl-ACP methyl ester carboxylesterase
MPGKDRLIFIHGLVSSGQGFKGKLLREHFPDILTPDFDGPLEARLDHLTAILSDQTGWGVIGSSFGGLMGTIFACQHPHQVERLVLLAPALIWPDFASQLPPPTSVPTVIFHGKRDDVIPLDLMRPLAEQVFLNLTFHVVDDDHQLHTTVQSIDWPSLLRD